MIEVGMYVRTKRGIKKIEQIEGDKIIVDRGCFIYYKEDIIKMSYDIIDLIEEGDFVNSKKVIYVEEFNALEYLCIDADGNIYYSAIDKECNKPKTIVTHEQFENMEYKVKE